MDAHGYVFTYPAHSVPMRYGMGLGYLHRREFCDTHLRTKDVRLPRKQMSNGTELTFFISKPDYEVLRSH